MPVGLIIGGIASAASALGSAKIQSNAAKKAAEKQQVGTDKALQVQQQANAPYLALGQQAAQRLQQTPFQPYTQQFRPGQPNNGYQAPQGPPPTLGSIGQPQGQPMGQGGPQGRLAVVQAPNGEMAHIPEGPDLEQALAKGAKRIG